MEKQCCEGFREKEQQKLGRCRASAGAGQNAREEQQRLGRRRSVPGSATRERAREEQQRLGRRRSVPGSATRERGEVPEFALVRVPYRPRSPVLRNASLSRYSSRIRRQRRDGQKINAGDYRLAGFTSRTAVRGCRVSSSKMATPTELSLEEIRNYLLENGGTARNHDLVKHFKRFLTDPETRVEARNRFKEYVNILATIKNEEGEKYLVLKKKYRQPFLDLSSPKQVGSPLATPDLATSPLSPLSPLREPPPYRPPPPAPLSPSSSSSHANLEESTTSISIRVKNGNSAEPGTSVSSPPVPPRRKSQDKLKVENKENVDRNRNSTSEAVIKEDEAVTTTNPSSAEQLSVRERMQRFNRMASETDLHARHNDTTVPARKRADKGADEDDSASVASQLDGKSREWLVRAAQGDYQALAKLAAEEPRLTRLKDPTSTALHWGAKHGDENIVKLIAGTYRDCIKSVNETTNGGYTPLHIAMQFGHENIFNLLVQVYGANQEVRDYSGRKARQYLASQEAAVSQDTFHKIKARKKHAEKDLGFLRIGSLNVRVKRTTEAFSQFLGVATSSTANNNEKIHKSWGSADNVQLDQKLMPPPKYAPIKKRRSRRPQDFSSSQEQQQVASQPTTPLLQGKIRPNRAVQRRPTSTTSVSTSSIASGSVQQNGDSDSDTACGFDSAWRGSAQL